MTAPTIAEALPDRGLVLLEWPDGRKTLHTTSAAQALLDAAPPPVQPPAPAMPAEVLMPHVAAKQLRVDTRTLARWAAAGRLTAIRTVNGQRRYLPHEILALRGEGDD